MPRQRPTSEGAEPADAAPTPPAATDAPPADAAPTPPAGDGEPELDELAFRFVSTLFRMREVVSRIHAAQGPGRDGTPAVGAFARALLAVGGRLPGFPPDPWPLKHALDVPIYASDDPARNHATRALVSLLFDCLEEGRARPNRGEEDLARIAEHWPNFAHRAEAVEFERGSERAAHALRERAASEAHATRLANPAQPFPKARRAEPDEPPEPAEMTVG